MLHKVVVCFNNAHLWLVEMEQLLTVTIQTRPKPMQAKVAI